MACATATDPGRSSSRPFVAAVVPGTADISDVRVADPRWSVFSSRKVATHSRVRSPVRQGSLVGSRVVAQERHGYSDNRCTGASSSPQTGDPTPSGSFPIGRQRRVAGTNVFARDAERKQDGNAAGPTVPDGSLEGWTSTASKD